uniref:EF-hand domain-containing protein n=1 Tax=Macrostomum lignano TaxID=282301 RepID=A0A1I8FZL1_9PLAT
MLSERRERSGSCWLAAAPACALSWRHLPPGWRSPSPPIATCPRPPSALSASPQQQKRNPPPPLLRHRRQHRRLRPILQLASPSRQQQRRQPRSRPLTCRKSRPLAATRRKFNPSLEFPEFSHPTSIAQRSLRYVDEDHDSRINFREFLAIFRKARAGQLDYSGELMAWYDCYVEVSEINVEEVGVMEAKNFFESKIAIQSADGKLQAELREQRLRRQAEEEEKQRSRDSFRNTRAMFT